jgi:hypothetical protein
MIDASQNGARFFDEPSTRFGKSNFALRPVKETDLEFLFELADLLAQWGLADIQSDCGSSEVQFFSDRDEILQVPQFHSCLSFGPR